MSKIQRSLASIATGLGLALTATLASAVNPIINGNFKELIAPGTNYRNIVGWTSNMYVHPIRTLYAPTQISFESDVHDVVPDATRPITHFGRFDCLYNCAKGYTSSISQLITGLEQNKTYTVSFYIQGWAWTYTYDTNTHYPDIPPFLVSLGSQTAPPILLPANTPIFDGSGASAPWLKKSVTFTYTDPGSTALLTFTQNFSGQLIYPRDPLLPTTVIQAYDSIFLSMAGDGIVEEPPQGPTLSVQKALDGNRVADTDQFTVQILNGSTVVNATTNSTTTGSGATVTSGSGTTGATTLVAGTSYTIREVASGTTNLGRYSSTLSCTNASGSTLPTALNTTFTLAATDKVSCTLTNKAKPATLTVRQRVNGPLPVSAIAPFIFDYSGTNGWVTQQITSLAADTLVSGVAQTLSSFNTATPLSTTLPDARWSVASFNCMDLNAAVSGNPTGSLASTATPSVTIPASHVRAGAALRCTATMARSTP